MTTVAYKECEIAFHWTFLPVVAVYASFEGYLSRTHHLWCREILLPIFISWITINTFLSSIQSWIEAVTFSLSVLSSWNYFSSWGILWEGSARSALNTEFVQVVLLVALRWVYLGIFTWSIQWVHFFIILLNLSKIIVETLYLKWVSLSSPRNFPVTIFVSSYSRLKKGRVKVHILPLLPKDFLICDTGSVQFLGTTTLSQMCHMICKACCCPWRRRIKI